MESHTIIVTGLPTPLTQVMCPMGRHFLLGDLPMSSTHTDKLSEDLNIKNPITYDEGALGYLESSTFNSRHNDAVFKQKIAACVNDNGRTLVVRHHNQKYGGRFPLWVIIEFFSMGMLSYLYADLHTPDKKKIAVNSFHTSAEGLQSWLRCTTELRNRCAHYSRLYYWIFSSIPKSSPSLKRIPRNLPDCVGSFIYSNNNPAPKTNHRKSDPSSESNSGHLLLQ